MQGFIRAMVSRRADCTCPQSLPRLPSPAPAPWQRCNCPTLPDVRILPRGGAKSAQTEPRCLEWWRVELPWMCGWCRRGLAVPRRGVWRSRTHAGRTRGNREPPTEQRSTAMRPLRNVLWVGGLVAVAAVAGPAPTQPGTTSSRSAVCTASRPRPPRQATTPPTRQLRRLHGRLPGRHLRPGLPTTLCPQPCPQPCPQRVCETRYVQRPTTHPRCTTKPHRLRAGDHLQQELLLGAGHATTASSCYYDRAVARTSRSRRR